MLHCDAWKRNFRKVVYQILIHMCQQIYGFACMCFTICSIYFHMSHFHLQIHEFSIVKFPRLSNLNILFNKIVNLCLQSQQIFSNSQLVQVQNLSSLNVFFFFFLTEHLFSDTVFLKAFSFDFLLKFSSLNFRTKHNFKITVINYQSLAAYQNGRSTAKSERSGQYRP